MYNLSGDSESKVVRCDSPDCNLKNCYLCNSGMSRELYLKFHEKGWPKRIVPVFVYLEKSNNREWQHLTHDIIPYIATHWKAFWPNGSSEKPSDKSWKECIKALISRKKNLFESGKTTHGTRGFWKLRPEVDKTMSMDVSSSDEDEKSSVAEKTLFDLIHNITNSSNNNKKENPRGLDLPPTSINNEVNLNSPKLPEKDTFTLPPIASLSLAPDFSADFERFINKYGIKPQQM